MYSREMRMKAVQLFIDSNCNENHVLKTLGYPSPNALRNWHREYLSTGDLHPSSIHKARYSQQQTETAVQYYVEHKTTLVQTCRALGYPTRGTLRQWIEDRCPDALRKDTCKRSHCSVKYTDEEKRAAVEEFAVDRVPVYKVAIKYGVSKATISSWKHQLLGKDTHLTMESIQAESVSSDLKADLEAQITDLKSQIYHLQMERDAIEVAAKLLKKAKGINLNKLKNYEKAEVIDALRGNYQLKELLQLLQIAKSSYCYSHNAAMAPDKYICLRNTIRTEFKNNLSCYGYRRIHALLKKLGQVISEKVVRRIMREEQLFIRTIKRKKYNSYMGEISPAAANLLQRDFHSEAPNQKWLTDLTEFPLPSGKVYLSPVVDCFDGFLVSWKIGVSPNAALVNSMLDDAISRLNPHERPIIHSDRGCHYRWPDWIARTEAAGLTRSMSKKGCSPDNSACEGFFGRVKNEMFYGQSWLDVSVVQFISALDTYLHWYNEKRIKMSLGAMSPVEYRHSLGLS